MDIIICIKRVPDISDLEIEIAPGGRDIRRDDLVYGVNEWDNFAIEEAVRLKEAHGGTVTALTVGDEDSEEVLRRALAMGVDEAIRLAPSDAETLDALGVASILAGAIEGRSFDLILTGSVSSDSSSGLVGGVLAAQLGIPQVALATAIEVAGETVRVRHEVEAGLERVVEMDLPALVTVQTGINEPRYVSIRGIRKVAGIEVPVVAVDSSAESPWVSVEEIFVPSVDRRAEILEGPPEEVVDQLVERLKTSAGV